MRALTSYLLLLATLVANLAPRVARADENAGDAGAAEPDVLVAPDSPQATVIAFLDAAKKGRYDEAARFLDVPTGTEAPAVLAFRVKVVLDRKLWIDVDALSAKSEGKLDDGLRPRLEELGRIEQADGLRLPVRLVRVDQITRDGSDNIGWRLARSTVTELNRLYLDMPDRLVLDNVPPTLRRVGPADLMLWQWLALPLLVLVCAALGRLLGYLTRRVGLRIALATTAEWDDAFVARMGGPISLLWAVALAHLSLPWLVLSVVAEGYLTTVLRSCVTFALFWAVLRSIDLSADLLATSPALKAHSARSLLPVLTRIVKVAVSAMLVVAVLSGLGLPVASLLAGLGVGGIALALAAQKTVENVFGAVSIGVDVPFKVGDTVRIDGVVGTIEALGLRSTRMRTLDRTLITLPNGGLADARIENLTARDRLRLSTTIGVEYGTSASQLTTVLEKLEACLRAHPLIWPDTVNVRFVGFGASSLDIEIMAWFLTQDWNEFLVIRQEVLVEFMKIVEAHSPGFAFPTRTVHLVQPPST